MERLGKRVHGWIALAWAGLRKRARALTPRRAAAVVVALSLWMGIGGMDSSGVVNEIEGEVFGEVHWYEE